MEHQRVRSFLYTGKERFHSNEQNKLPSVQKIIVWEQGEEVLFQDEKVYLGNKELDGYRFKSNYYFMSGDNSMNSVDSRFWGLIPEDFIVGKAALVITSRSRDTGKIRWNRVFKRIE